MKIRQDAWTDENDLLLAETVLRHVREGSTQLNAFEEVGDKLNRTSAACGFRWNAVVRHQYEKALELAKKQRKQRQRILGKDQSGKKKLLYSPPFAKIGELEPIMNNGPIEDEFATEFSMIVPPAALVAPEPEPAPVSAFAAPVSAPMQQINNSQVSLDTVIAYLQNLKHSNFHAEILKSENERLKREINDLKRHNHELQGKIDHLEQDTETIQEDYETLMKIMNRARKLVLFEEEERPQTTFKMDRNGNLEKVAE